MALTVFFLRTLCSFKVVSSFGHSSQTALVSVSTVIPPQHHRRRTNEQQKLPKMQKKFKSLTANLKMGSVLNQENIFRA